MRLTIWVGVMTVPAFAFAFLLVLTLALISHFYLFNFL